MSMTSVAPLYLAIALAALSQGGKASTGDSGADRLEFMKDSVQTYELTGGSASGGALKLDEKPVFRLGKQYAEDLQDGAIFLWTGEHGRPEAAIQVFLIKNASEPQGLWIHEFTSLATSGLKAVRKGRPWWTPTTPGLEFKPIPDAPKPAETAAQRLRQMRSFADGFRASDDFGGRGWSELRMLTTPICRYGEPGSRLVDGALFAFVLGTDPEVFLFLEARPGKEGLEWQYGLAPMTVFAVKGSYRGKAVWELPNRHPSYDPRKPFFDKSYEP
jgi:hypothetical protein